MGSVDRAGLLRNGARIAGGVVAASVGLPALAQAAPSGDDLAYLQFAAVAGYVSIALDDAILHGRHLTPTDRKAIRAIRAENVAASKALTAVLGADTPLSYDFTITFPKSLLRTRGTSLAGAVRLERTLGRVLIAGVRDVQDAASRAVLGRLLVVAAAHEAALVQLRRGAPATAPVALPTPLSLEAAGPVIDAYLAP